MTLSSKIYGRELVWHEKCLGETFHLVLSDRLYIANRGKTEKLAGCDYLWFEPYERLEYSPGNSVQVEKS